MSEIPLLTVRTQLWPTVTTTANGGANDPNVIIYINDLLGRFYSSLDFVGKFEDVVNWPINVDVNNQQTIGLPGKFITAEYIHDNIGDLAIRNTWQRYEDEYNAYSNLRHADDLGDEFCTWFDFPTPGKLFVKTAAGVTGSPYITIEGLDQNGNPINDVNGVGERVGLSAGGATTVNTFSKVTSIIKTAINTNTLLFVVNPTTSVQTQIGLYGPNEIYPRCRRYYLFTASSITTVTMRCRRRFIPVSFDNDMICPGLFSALKNGLMSINFENQDDVQRSQYHWNNAKLLLDGELQQYLGEAQTGTFQMDQYTGLSSMINIP